jgi:hypothetical protein
MQERTVRGRLRTKSERRYLDQRKMKQYRNIAVSSVICVANVISQLSVGSDTEITFTEFATYKIIEICPDTFCQDLFLAFMINTNRSQVFHPRLNHSMLTFLCILFLISYICCERYTDRFS